MKKIAFVTRKMIPGGVEKALLNMVKEIDFKKYNVTIFLLEKGGEWENKIPNEVEIKYVFKDNNSVKDRLGNYINKKEILNALKLIKNVILSNKTKDLFKSFHYISQTLEKNAEVYDAVISYHSPINFSVVYAINNIKARKRILWIHTEIKKEKEFVKLFGKAYEEYDNIFTVSSEVKKQFIEIYPNLYNNIKIYYNHINIDEIKNLSDEFDNIYEGDGHVKILTLGRLSYERGADMIPSVVNTLVTRGTKVIWYLVGEGNLKTVIQQEITKYNLSSNIVFLGSKNNPYPYIKMCDIYVNPAREESYGIVLSEAKALCKPIITTNTSGALEQISNNINGIIVERDVFKMANEIEKIIIDKSVAENLKENLSKEKECVKSNISMLYDLV